MPRLADQQTLIGGDVAQPVVGIGRRRGGGRGGDFIGIRADADEIADAATDGEENKRGGQRLRAARRQLHRRTRGALGDRRLRRLRALDRADEGKRHRLLQDVVEAAAAEIGAVSKFLVQPPRFLVLCQALLQLVALFGRDLAIEQSGELGFERQFPEIGQFSTCGSGGSRQARQNAAWRLRSAKRHLPPERP